MGAYARARTILSSDATGAVAPTRPLPPNHGRRNTWLGALAAVFLSMAIGASMLLSDAGYATERGELRRVPLQDGSIVTLNTDSQIRVQMSKSSRTIQLSAGESFFEVASDASRPFFVEAGEASFRAVGTAFVVRRIEGQPVEITVQEGVVEITSPNGECV